MGLLGKGRGPLAIPGALHRCMDVMEGKGVVNYKPTCALQGVYAPRNRANN